MISAYFGVFFLNSNMQSDIEDAQNKMTQLQDIKKRKDNVQAMNQDIQTIKNINDNLSGNSTNYYDLLQNVENVTPADIHFTEQICMAGTMTIRGTADNESLISQFAANLKTLKNISNVWINTTQFGDGVTFDISFTYNDKERAEVQ